MAISKQVYDIGFNTEKAEEGIEKLESLVSGFEELLAEAFEGDTVSDAIDSLVENTTKIGDGISAGLKKTGRPLEQFEKTVQNVNVPKAIAASLKLSNALNISAEGSADLTAFTEAVKTAAEGTSSFVSNKKNGGLLHSLMGLISKLSPVAAPSKQKPLLLASMGPLPAAIAQEGIDRAKRTIGEGIDDSKAFERAVVRFGDDFGHLITGAAMATEYSSAEAAAAANDWWAKGMKPKQIQYLLPPTLDFASANPDLSGKGRHPAVAASILEKMLRLFKLDDTDDLSQLQENAYRVADVLTKTAVESKLSFDELIALINTVGTQKNKRILPKMGSSIEEVSAIFYGLADVGIKEPGIVDELKGAFDSIQKDPFKKNGIEIPDGEIDFHKLLEIIKSVDNATKEMKERERKEKFSALFGNVDSEFLHHLLGQSNKKVFSRNAHSLWEKSHGTAAQEAKGTRSVNSNLHLPDILRILYEAWTYKLFPSDRRYESIYTYLKENEHNAHQINSDLEGMNIDQLLYEMKRVEDIQYSLAMNPLWHLDARKQRITLELLFLIPEYQRLLQDVYREKQIEQEDINFPQSVPPEDWQKTERQKKGDENPRQFAPGQSFNIDEIDENPRQFAPGQFFNIDEIPEEYKNASEKELKDALAKIRKALEYVESPGAFAEYERDSARKKEIIGRSLRREEWLIEAAIRQKQQPKEDSKKGQGPKQPQNSQQNDPSPMTVQPFGWEPRQSVMPDDQSVMPDDQSVMPDDQSVMPDDQSVMPDDQSVMPDDQANGYWNPQAANKFQTSVPAGTSNKTVNNQNFEANVTVNTGSGDPAKIGKAVTEALEDEMCKLEMQAFYASNNADRTVC